MNNIEDGELIRISSEEKRIVLTRDTRLIKRLKNYVFIESDHLRDQLRQVIDLFKLDPFRDFFKRCILCNELIEEVEKDEIKEEVPIYVYNTQSLFMRCPKCRRIYWGGTHRQKAEERLKELLSK